MVRRTTIRVGVGVLVGVGVRSRVVVVPFCHTVGRRK